MNIGLLGAGMLGAVLARRLVERDHRVKIANSRGPETIAELAAGMGAQAVEAAEAARDVDVLVVSIPQGAVDGLRDLIAAVSDDVVLIDTGNYYPGLRDKRIDEIEMGLPESQWVERQLGRPVIKAFNSISFTSLAGAGRPVGAPGRIALPVSGDDSASKAVALALVDDLGFDGVDAGSLTDSWRQQPGAPVYCTDLDEAGVRSALKMADRASAPARRDLFIEEMLKVMRSGGQADLIALGRSIYGAP